MNQSHDNKVAYIFKIKMDNHICSLIREWDKEHKADVHVVANMSSYPWQIMIDIDYLSMVYIWDMIDTWGDSYVFLYEKEFATIFKLMFSDMIGDSYVLTEENSEHVMNNIRENFEGRSIWEV